MTLSACIHDMRRSIQLPKKWGVNFYHRVIHFTTMPYAYAELFQQISRGAWWRGIDHANAKQGLKFSI